ncbi:MAG: GAF domain-containing protein [Desulfovibrionaceae bacterium]|nr:GAF domain-containing protein [Desulfovibrionaceae bacterium]MBF0513969.1 GAF domain-containing protein [Desulfovibrionaceae bacterium]
MDEKTQGAPGGEDCGGVEARLASLAKDGCLDRLLDVVRGEARRQAAEHMDHLKQLARIGLALSGQTDMDRLLEMIVDEARRLAFADAGTLYIVNPERSHLLFVILQNDTMNTRMGGATGQAISLPPVPLFCDDGGENHAHVSAHVALSGEIVNIPDVYEAQGFDFTGPRRYDQATGYRSKSMLVIPMRNHENEIIGVLQLLNAKDAASGAVRPFDREREDLVASLASQAAVALTNAQLVRDLKTLLDAFIRSIAAAIDAKSPYTAGHISRVVELTMLIAEKINQDQAGPFKDVRLSDAQLEELSLAAWMHDVGKIVTPEHVVDKSTKLEAVFDRCELVKTRFRLFEQAAAAGYHAACASLRETAANQGDCAQPGEALAQSLALAKERFETQAAALREDREFVLACNTAFMDEGKLARLRDLAARTFPVDGEDVPYLTENELYNLSIVKGTLNAEERAVIENHARITFEMLGRLPFPKRLAKVPYFAGSHHEKLDGTGYPNHLTAKDVPLQARILAVADIFEALTAKDRPYKKPMPLSQAIKILGFMEKDKHIDADVLRLFYDSGACLEYAAKQLSPEQIDIAAGQAPA